MTIKLSSKRYSDIMDFLKFRIKTKGWLSVIGSFLHYYADVSNVFYLDRLLKLGKKDEMKLFDKICIQTQTECNYNCSFCPNKKIDRPHGIMKISLYRKIIDELHDLKFSGVIYPYIQEPLLDDRIVDLCFYASWKCPNALVNFETNGSLLTEELSHRLCSIRNFCMIVNDYRNGKIIEKVNSFDLNNEERKKIILRKRSLIQKLTNRAGNIGEPIKLNNFCNLPFVEFYIAYDGKVLLCCQDWKHEEIMGDLNENTIQEIWNNEKYQEFRKNLLKLNRIGLCSKCDYWGLE